MTGYTSGYWGREDVFYCMDSICSYSSEAKRTKLQFPGRVLLEYSISQRDVKRINSFL